MSPLRKALGQNAEMGALKVEPVAQGVPELPRTAFMALAETGNRLRGCDLGTRVPCYPDRLNSSLFPSIKKIAQGDDTAC